MVGCVILGPKPTSNTHLCLKTFYLFHSPPSSPLVCVRIQRNPMFYKRHLNKACNVTFSMFALFTSVDILKDSYQILKSCMVAMDAMCRMCWYCVVAHIASSGASFCRKGN